MRQQPNITINGTNPFWIINAANAMFDQEDLPDNNRHLPMLPFQETACIMAALYTFTKIAAPSQSGKTASAELIAATYAYAFPGTTTLILSTVAEQSERLREDIKDKLISRHRVSELRELDRDGDGVLRIKANKSKIVALPHSLKALTGHPANLVILDEMEKYDKDPARIYAEAVARTGQKGGTVIVISSVDEDGQLDATKPEGYRGSFFYTMFARDFQNRKDPNKDAMAARFTYHVSPFLRKNLPAIQKELQNRPDGEQYFKAHYLSIPRKAKGQAVFQGFFKRQDHVREEASIPLNPSEPLFLCYDPGLTKAAVLGQLDPTGVRLMYLRAWLGTREQLFEDFVKACAIKTRRAFPNFEVQYFADVAARQENNQTALTNADIIARVTGQYPMVKYQLIAPGIQAQKSFMKRVDGFYISDQCDPILADAFESGLVLPPARPGTGQKEEWVKDGHYEHVGDASRYPVYYLCGGYSADALGAGGEYELQANPYVDHVTGY